MSTYCSVLLSYSGQVIPRLESGVGFLETESYVIRNGHKSKKSNVILNVSSDKTYSKGVQDSVLLLGNFRKA